MFVTPSLTRTITHTNCTEGCNEQGKPNQIKRIHLIYSRQPLSPGTAPTGKGVLHV